MKNAIYTIISIVLVVGAILYSNSVVMGQHNPAQAGANAARPNGAPGCAACAQEDSVSESKDAADNNLAEAPEPGPSSSGRPVHKQTPPPKTVQQTTSVSQQANAKAVAKGKGATAKAVAVNNTTVNNVTNNQTVEKVQQIHPVDERENTPPVETAPIETEEPVVVQTVQTPQAVVVAAQTAAPAPLPATGDLALSGIVGTSAIGAAAYSYVRSRRSLLRSTRKRP